VNTSIDYLSLKLAMHKCIEKLAQSMLTRGLRVEFQQELVNRTGVCLSLSSANEILVFLL